MTHSNRPWRSVRTPLTFTPHPVPVPSEVSDSGVRLATTKRPPPPPPEECYEVDLSALREADRRDLSALEELANQPSEIPPPADKPAAEKSTWDSRARLALELSKLGAFSKMDADAVVAEAERLGMAFTKNRSHVVVFDGDNFTLARNTAITRAFFKLDSFLRRMAEPKRRP